MPGVGTGSAAVSGEIRPGGADDGLQDLDEHLVAAELFHEAKSRGQFAVEGDLIGDAGSAGVGTRKFRCRGQGRAPVARLDGGPDRQHGRAEQSDGRG